MSATQTILTIGGILLLTFLILSYYRSSGTQTEIGINNEAIITGTGIAQSLFDEIQGKAFDENTTTTSVSDPNSLSSTPGKDSGESLRSSFDDVDDYRLFTTNDTLSTLGVFRSDIDVHYVSASNPDVISYTRTFAKRIDITVTNDFLTDTLKFSQIISY